MDSNEDAKTAERDDEHRDANSQGLGPSGSPGPTPDTAEGERATVEKNLENAERSGKQR